MPKGCYNFLRQQPKKYACSYMLGTVERNLNWSRALKKYREVVAIQVSWGKGRKGRRWQTEKEKRMGELEKKHNIFSWARGVADIWYE